MSTAVKLSGVGQKAKVSLVDDDEDIGRLFKDLADAGHFQLLDLFSEPASALRLLPQNPPDVLFMDVRLPKMSGIECVQRLKALIPAVHAIIFTVYPDGPTFFRSLMAGANGFLAKPFKIDELLEAIESVMRGEYVLGKVAAPYLIQLFSQFKEVKAQSMLTQREEQVLSCVFQRMTDKEIAAKLCIGTATVHTHLHRLFEKLGVSSRKGAIDKFLSVSTSQTASIQSL